MGKLPPKNLWSEIAVLGAIFLKPDTLPMIQELLTPSHFYMESNAVIFQTMIELRKEGDVIEPYSILTELGRSGNVEKSGGYDYIRSIIENCSTSAGWKYHVAQIIDTSMRRDLISIASNMQENLYGNTPTEEVISQVKSEVSRIDSSKESETTVSISDAIPDVFASLEQGLTFGVKSGFHEIDRVTMGWQAGDLIIVAGRPGSGKSVFAKDCSEHSGVPTLYFSLEMGKQQLIKRQISGNSGVNHNIIRSGKIDEQHWPAIVSACGKLSKMPIFYNDSGKMTIGKLCAIAETYKMKHDIGLIVIDYLQLIRSSNPKGSSREQEVSAISRELKSLARDLNIPIICLAQLNRSCEVRKPPIPILSDLRESGAIEQDADFVCFLYRPWMYSKKENPRSAQLIIAKGRNTRTGPVDLLFFGETQSFKNKSDMEE